MSSLEIWLQKKIETLFRGGWTPITSSFVPQKSLPVVWSIPEGTIPFNMDAESCNMLLHSLLKHTFLQVSWTSRLV